MHSWRVRYGGAAFALILVLGLPPGTRAQSLGSATKAELQAQLDELDAQDAKLQDKINSLETQKASLARDVALLDAEIADAKLAIRRRNVAIAQLSQNIQGKEDTIAGLDSKLQGEYASLAAIMRETDRLDTSPGIIAALTSSSISEFFADIDQFSSINQSMQDSFTHIRTDRAMNEQQKSDLEDQLAEETQLRQAQQLQQEQLQAQEAQKNKLIADTKGKESNYQSALAANQQTAAQIRAALFELTGTKAIPFEIAYQYAKLAEQQTGIRPAFLLGIITEESDFGQNVGTGNWNTDMNPARDKPIFAAITRSLGLDPNAMPVSRKPWYGWGGAMGPAQFIPSTWALYAGYSGPNWTYDPSKDRVGRLTGNKPPSPWDPKDAFMASALYLTDSGAGMQTPAAEFRAAMCYLAGCGNVGKKSLQFYGDQVQCLELKYQQDIDVITGSNDAVKMQANQLYYGQC